jgi:hydroxymethylglutaryl-CoA lyase
MIWEGQILPFRWVKQLLQNCKGMAMENIIIHEVGLRDGLQAEKRVVPSEEKIHWIESLFASGVEIIQIGSFVHPEKVPQMADTDTLFTHFNANSPDHVTLSGLVLNERGLERGLVCGVEMFCMGVSASETHSLKNTGMTNSEALARVVQMAKYVLGAGKTVQCSVQSAFGCGYEGPIAKKKVLNIVASYLEAGIRNISLADTAGHAHPTQVEDLYGAVRQMDAQVKLACHFHNTYGLGLANCYAALRSGVSYFETSFGGLGGCPFTKVSAGNVSTEDLVHSVQRMGLCRELQLEVIIDVACQVSAFFDRQLPGFILKSGSIVDFQGKGKSHENA